MCHLCKYMVWRISYFLQNKIKVLIALNCNEKNWEQVQTTEVVNKYIVLYGWKMFRFLFQNLLLLQCYIHK